VRALARGRQPPTIPQSKLNFMIPRQASAPVWALESVDGGGVGAGVRVGVDVSDGVEAESGTE